MVVDIGRAGETLKAVLGELSYRNLDEEPRFTGENTTTEFLAHEIFSQLVSAIRDGRLGPTATGVETIVVTLHESHVAWGRYEGRV